MATCPICGDDAPSGALFCPNDGTPLDRSWQDPRIGSTIAGRYKVLGRLGVGGMALVYLAHSASLGIDVALKLLRADLQGDPRAVARFAREARATSRIDHQNVVGVIDFGVAETGYCYLATEYVAGTTLATEIDRVGPFPLARAMHVAAQLAHGLLRAHQLGIAHRDLKPGNLMLTQRGSDPSFLKILDFGLAKSFHAGSDDGVALTRVGELFGTPEYMAPEQWLSGATGPHTDIYAFGVVLWELLVGRVPFTGGLGSLLLAHTEQMPDAPSRAASRELPQRVDELVSACLAKRPEQRPSSMASVLDSLRMIWDALPTPSSTASYARTVNAQRAPGALPDPTVYQSSQVDVVWDGPDLCDEIRRLHHLRNKRLADLGAVLWPGGWPAEADALAREVADAEVLIDLDGQEVAVLAAAIEEHAHLARQTEAVLRGELVDASLALSPETMGYLDETSPTERFDLDATVGSRPPPPNDPAARIRWTERRLFQVRRRAARESGELQAKLATKVSVLRSRELAVAPVQERLSSLVNRAAARRPDVRPLLVSFGQIDGAIAAYQALLDALEVA